MNDNFSQQAIAGRILGTPGAADMERELLAMRKAEPGQIRPSSQFDTVLGAQRELLDQLSKAVTNTRQVFAKAIDPRCSGEACGQTSDKGPAQAAIVEAIAGNNLLLASILRDLQGINERSVL